MRLTWFFMLATFSAAAMRPGEENQQLVCGAAFVALGKSGHELHFDLTTVGARQLGNTSLYQLDHFILDVGLGPQPAIFSERFYKPTDWQVKLHRSEAFNNLRAEEGIVGISRHDVARQNDSDFYKAEYADAPFPKSDMAEGKVVSATAANLEKIGFKQVRDDNNFLFIRGKNPERTLAITDVDGRLLRIFKEQSNVVEETTNLLAFGTRPNPATQFPAKYTITGSKTHLWDNGRYREPETLLRISDGHYNYDVSSRQKVISLSESRASIVAQYDLNFDSPHVKTIPGDTFFFTVPHEAVNDGSGFVLGTMNDIEKIDAVKSIAGRSLEEIEKNLKKEINFPELDYFIRPSDTLRGTLSMDFPVVKNAGTSHEAIASELNGAMERWVRNFDARDVYFIRSGQRYKISGVRRSSNPILSPLDPKAQTTQYMTLLNVDTGESVLFNQLTPLHIATLGFYGGVGTKSRTDPSLLLRVFPFLKKKD